MIDKIEHPDADEVPRNRIGFEGEYFQCVNCSMTVRHILNNDGEYICQNCGHKSLKSDLYDM